MSTAGLYPTGNAGYVYYEGDCFRMSKKPYIPPDVEQPTLAQTQQKMLKGADNAERIEVDNEVIIELLKLLKGEDNVHKEAVAKFYGVLCDDIKRERERIGGDWAVASAVPMLLNRDWRSHIR